MELTKDNLFNTICHWSTYNNTQCRHNIISGGLCKNHKHIFNDKDYELICEDELCENYSILECSIRSYNHLIALLTSVGLSEDSTFNVKYKSKTSIVETAIIEEENHEYVLLNEEKFYFEKKKIKNIKYVSSLIFHGKEYCKNKSVVIYRGGYELGEKTLSREIKLCEDCYRKIKNVPKYNVLKSILN